MQRPLYLVAALLLGILVAIPAPRLHADHCQAQPVQLKVQVQPQAYYYQAPALLLASPPSYYVGLSAADPELANLQRQILDRLQQLELRLPNSLPLTAGRNGLEILTLSCAKCHQGDKPKGDWLFDVQALSAEDKARIVEQVVAGSMPPRGGLQAAERKAVLRSLVK